MARTACVCQAMQVCTPPSPCGEARRKKRCGRHAAGSVFLLRITESLRSVPVTHNHPMFVMPLRKITGSRRFATKDTTASGRASPALRAAHRATAPPASRGRRTNTKSFSSAASSRLAASKSIISTHLPRFSSSPPATARPMPLGALLPGGAPSSTTHLTSSPLASTAGTSFLRMSVDTISKSSAHSDLTCVAHGSQSPWYIGWKPSSYM